jgi:hypothetical protein
VVAVCRSPVRPAAKGPAAALIETA